MLVDAELADSLQRRSSQRRISVNGGTEDHKTQDNDKIYIAYDRDGNDTIDAIPGSVATGDAIVYQTSGTPIALWRRGEH